MTYNTYSLTQHISDIMSRVSTRYPYMRDLRELSEDVRRLNEHHVDCLQTLRPDTRHIVAGCVYADMLDCAAQRNYLAGRADDDEAAEAAVYMDRAVKQDMDVLRVLTSVESIAAYDDQDEEEEYI